jgi:hypothetical protein
MTYKIQIELLSDTTFGRGDGVAGLIDSEVEHDEIGLPYLRGRALKGLLAEECANMLFSIKKFAPNNTNWENAAINLFGFGGSSLNETAKMHVGDAILPSELKSALEYEINESKSITKDEVLQSLTTIRRQTAMEANGSPKETSLRSSRAILRKTVFEAEIDSDFAVDSDEIILLAMSCNALQRAGLGRNRGRGKIKVELLQNALPNAIPITNYLENFEANL